MKKKGKSSFGLVFRFWSLAIILVFVLFLPYTKTIQEPEKSVLGDFIASNYPVKTGIELEPEISAASAVVIDLESAVVFAGKNPDEPRPPASITKLMTAVVALEYYQPDQILEVKRLVKNGPESEMGLAVGDKVSVNNLVYGLLIPSGNDAAYTLADNYEGGIENFIYSMNKKAEKLHMKNTHFETVSGLDSTNHYSSARDLAFLAIYALRNPFISKVVATYGITLKDVTGQKVYTMKNVNEFLGYLNGLISLPDSWSTMKAYFADAEKNSEQITIAFLTVYGRSQCFQWTTLRSFSVLSINRWILIKDR